MWKWLNWLASPEGVSKVVAVPLHSDNYFRSPGVRFNARMLAVQFSFFKRLIFDRAENQFWQ